MRRRWKSPSIASGQTARTTSATIYVERLSQKGIIIGQKGQMIKKIGTEARQDLIAIVDGPVYLDLHVSVLKNWRSDPRAMQRFGYRVQRDKE